MLLATKFFPCSCDKAHPLTKKIKDGKISLLEENSDFLISVHHCNDDLDQTSSVVNDFAFHAGSW